MAAAVWLAPPALAETAAGSTSHSIVPADLPETPADYAVTAREALRAADADPTLLAERRSRGKLTAQVTAEPVHLWEVGYFDSSEKVVLVVVNGLSGEVTESWTGAAVSWPMARGREGQFGHLLNAPWVWIPMAAIFFFGLLDFRRPLRIAHLDLLVLLSFGISEAFFNAAEIGVSVPLYYPPLLYLLARALWVGFRGGGRGLRPSASVRVLVILAVVLFAFRLTINIADSGVIDVGYAGVVGADRITDAQPIYGEGAFPDDNPTGDTYGPANYFAYVPFEQALPWSGAWDELPAAHAAALFFDLLTVLGLFVLGRNLGGRGSPGTRLGVVLAFAWLAYPYTDYVLQSNANDSLIAALLVWSLVAFARPVARGALLALATAAKFAPLALLPLYLAGRRGLLARDDPGGRRAPLRPALLAAAAFAAVLALMLAHPAIDPGLSTFWDRTLASQLNRTSPFSIWGQANLEWLQTVVKLGALALGIGVAFLPARRTTPSVAALAAAVVIAVQLTAEHWFYLYIVWFLPALLLAIAVPGRERSAPLGSAP